MINRTRLYQYAVKGSQTLDSWIQWGLKGVVIAGVAGILSSPIWFPHAIRGDYIGRVTGKTNKILRDQDRYLIQTKDENGETRVFENRDSWLEFKVNSSDIQASIEEGRTYRFHAYGFRWYVPTVYKNILSAEEVKPAPGLKADIK